VNFKSPGDADRFFLAAYNHTTMHDITNIETFEKAKSSGASLILFGGEQCTVCQSIRPQVSNTLKQHFAQLRLYYVDCEKSPEICAQHGIFSLPVIQVYIEGMMVTEAGRVFGLNELIERIKRPYMMWLDERASSSP